MTEHRVPPLVALQRGRGRHCQTECSLMNQDANDAQQLNRSHTAGNSPKLEANGIKASKASGARWSWSG